MAASSEFLVSVVVAVFNAEAYINNCLASLQYQTYPIDKYEIIVVDDGSKDATGSIVRTFENVRYVYQANQGPSVARNKGIEKARGDIIAFIDSDCEATATWLESLVHIYRENVSDQRVAAVGGAQIGHPDDDVFARKVDCFLRGVGFIGDYVKPHASVSMVSHNASCNASYRSTVLREVGGFRPGLFPGEDVDLDKRLRDKGHIILFNPKAVVYHHRIKTTTGWIKMLQNYGKASANNVLIHGPFRLIQLVPFLMVLLIFVLSASFYLPHTAIVWMLLLLSYVIMNTYIKKRSDLSVKTTFIFVTQALFFFTQGFWKTILIHMFSKPIDRAKELRPIH